MAVAYPLTAIVAQDEMKRALMIAAVDPDVGGVLLYSQERSWTCLRHTLQHSPF